MLRSWRDKIFNEKIKVCKEGVCEGINIPADVFVDSDDELNKDNIDGEPGDEVLITHKSDVNACSTVLYVDASGKELKKYSGARDICDYKKIGGGMVVSNYRDGAMWRQDLIRIKNKTMELVFSDSCLECEEIKRQAIIDGVEQKMLVNKSENIMERKQIQGAVIADKAFIAASREGLREAKAYLIKGDKVFLVDSESDENNQFFFLINYKVKNEKIISRWIRCEDLDGCN